MPTHHPDGALLLDEMGIEVDDSVAVDQHTKGERRERIKDKG
jgi:hypothetical protein